MRAKKIYEVQNFEQGGDSYEKLKIGEFSETRLVQLLQNHLSGEILDDFDEFNEYIKDYYKNPFEYDIDIKSQYYDAIEWAYYNEKEAFDQYINENAQEFKQGANPYASLGVGISRLVKGAQVYWYPISSSWFQISTNDNKAKTGGQLTKQHWIVFPSVNYRGLIRFGKTVNNNTTFVEDYREATNGGIDWHRKENEDPIDEKIADQLTDWFLTHADEVMPKAIEVKDREIYMDMVTI